MNTSKIIKAYIGAGTYSTTEPITQGDYGYILQIEGTVLPATYRVDFANDRHEGEALTVYGNENGAEVPKELIDTGKDIFAFYYYIEEGFGKTAYTWKIPNNTRAQNGDREPTPTQQDSIDQLIVRSNGAVDIAERKAEEASTSAQSASDSAIEASRSESRAQTHALNAERSSTNADLSANDASESAEAAARSANQAAQIKADVESLAEDAQGYADASEQSASASANSASQAQGFAQSASASAQSASGYASQADISANTASAKASEASTSASTASAKASESAQSASQALSYKTDAESAKTASQTAQGLAESARDTAVSAKTDAESARDDAVQAKEDAESAVVSISGALDEKAPVITDTASGSIASFSDGADNLPLKSLVININPIQDLHGQDSPYPAGGGKNKFDADFSDKTMNGTVITKLSDGKVSTSGVPTSPFDFVIGTVTLSAGDYILNGCPVGGGSSKYRLQVTDFPVRNNLGQDSGSGVSFTLSEEMTVALRIQVYTGAPASLTYAPMIRLASITDATYSPYENLCPISGWTEVQTNQSGVNVWDEEWEVGNINPNTGINQANPNTIRSKNYIPCKGNAQYNMLLPWAHVFYYDSSKQFIMYKGNGVTEDGNIHAKVMTTPSNAAFMRFRCTGAYGNTYNHDISINYPSTDHDYHPYTGRSINISLGQTVYGGKLDVLSGELTVDRAMVNLGTLNWEKYSVTQGNLFRYTLSSMQATPQSGLIPAICSNYKSVSQNQRTNATVSSGATTKNIDIIDNRYSDAVSFKTAMNGVQLVYELAEPIEIQLSANQLNSLYGVNNIWADSGDTEVEYRADTKLFIERLTAPDSADMIADANIVSGQYFMVGNSLYKATANIANGSAIVVGTNCTRVSLAQALNEINA